MKSKETIIKKFDKLKEKGDPSEKEALVEEICNELMLHAELEEQLFYRAAREAIDEDDLRNEAAVEHASAKELIEQIQAMDVSDEMLDAKVTVLGEYMEHHLEEEKELFPKVKKAKVDLEALGEEMAMLKQSMLVQPMAAAGAKKRGSRGASPGK